MAHFAKVGDDGIVERVTVVSNTVTDPETTGTDDESLGQAFLTEHFGAGTYVQCSYNDNIRGHFPGVGDTYDSVNDIFHKPQPFPSWTLNTDTGYWEPPLARPTVPSLGLDLLYFCNKREQQSESLRLSISVPIVLLYAKNSVYDIPSSLLNVLDINLSF